MSGEWSVNPEYADVVSAVLAEREARKEEGSMANCTNCVGTDRHIYVENGKTKSINCQACNGTGQK